MHADNGRTGGWLGTRARCFARPRCGAASIRRAVGLREVPDRDGVERLLQVGLRATHELSRCARFHPRVCQEGAAGSDAEAAAGVSLRDQVLAQRGGRHLRQPASLCAGCSRASFLRHGLTALGELALRRGLRASQRGAAHWGPAERLRVKGAVDAIPNMIGAAGVVVVVSGLKRCDYAATAARASRASSPAVCCRSPGALANARSTASASDRGSSGRTSSRPGGGSWMCAHSFSTSLSLS